jgi:hypothetical protein
VILSFSLCTCSEGLHLLFACFALSLPVSQVNAELTVELGIPQAAAVTCVKPSGTVSQLVDSASGIHPRHSEYYIRRVRCNKVRVKHAQLCQGYAHG